MTEAQVKIVLDMAIEFRRAPNGEFSVEARALEAALNQHEGDQCSGCIAKARELRAVTSMLEEEAHFRSEYRMALEECEDHCGPVDAIVLKVLGQRDNRGDADA